MNPLEAKEILTLYRPGTEDAHDPAFAEALQLCQRDPELKHWFDEHCEVYTALRARLKGIPVPEGLKEQILAERKVHSTTFSRRSIVLAAVTAVAVLTGLLSLLLKPREDTSLLAFQSQMTTTSLSVYGMYETNDLTEIRSYFTQRGLDAGYVLPGGLEKNAKPTGCVAITWHGHRVSMICFHSGKDLPPGEKSDLFLFVTGNSSVSKGPKSDAPILAKVNRATTASWSRGGKTYLLVADGDEEFLRKHL